MELTVLVRFDGVSNYIGNKMQQAIIVRENTEEDCYHAAHQRCMNICGEIRRDNCGDPTYSWVKEIWDKDVPMDSWDENQDPEKERTAPFINDLEELEATSALLKSVEVDFDEEDDEVRDVIPFLGDDDYIFDDGSNPFEEDDDHLF